MQIDRERLVLVCAGALTGSAASAKLIDRRAVDAILADIEAQGFVVVPREPTEAMVRSGGAAFDHPSLYMGGSSETGKRKARAIWSAMIGAGKGRDDGDIRYSEEVPACSAQPDRHIILTG